MSDCTPDAQPEKRCGGRLAIEIPIAVRERGAHRLPATLQDLSCTGCRIGNVFLARSGGGDVFVRIPGLEPLASTVCWTDGPAAGLRFHRPLHPAVFQRIAALHANAPCAAPALPHADKRPIAELPRSRPVGTRREQIIAGYTLPEPGILLEKRPEPGGRSIMTLVRRNTARRADHRHEERFAAPSDAELRAGEQAMPSRVANLSPSGVMALGALRQEIGDTVAVRFGEHEAIWGTVVWKREGSFGLALPPGAIHLDTG